MAKETDATGGTLSFAQIEAIAMKAGAKPAQAVILAAIAKAESGGSVTAHNPDANTGDNSYGLWQINMFGSMGPARLQEYGLSSNNDLFDPLTNAKIAVKMMNASGFEPWSTYTSGKYQQFVSQAEQAIESAKGVNVAAVVKNVANMAAAGGQETPADLQTAKSETVGQYLDNPDIESTYGYLAAYLKNPEVGPILAKAAKNGWGQDELLGALEKTSWWKKTSDSARSWQAQQRLDPATAKQRLNQMQQQIQQLAQSTLGERLNPKRVADMANAAIASNWSDAQLQAAVGAEFKYQGQNAKYQGAAGQTITGLQKLAGEYAVPISNSTMKNWTKLVLEGNNTVQDFQSYLQAQAESLYPTLAAPLKAGVTTQDYFSPYAQLASQILEKPVDSIDVMNPKWNKALNTVQPDGTRAPMTLSAWSTYLRGLPEFRQTEQAKSSAADFAVNLGNIFGKISTPTTAGASLTSSGS